MCNPFSNKNNRGRSIKHGEAHKKDHHTWSRRDFMNIAGMALLGSTLQLGGSSVQAFAKSPMEAALNSANVNDRILILIRLKGGNDGINTIIPTHSYSSYLNRRPNIAIPENDIVDLGEGYGLHPSLAGLMPFWNEGNMKIIQRVGYPNTNYSHFRASDILATASDSDEVIPTGWMGRYFEHEYPAYLEAPPAAPLAIQIGNNNDLAFRANETNMSIVFRDPERFYSLAQSGQLYHTDNLPSCYRGEELGFLRGIANNSFRFSESIKAAYDSSMTNATYPTIANGLADQLAVVARLIKGNLGTKLYMVTLDGFDTHVGQLGGHSVALSYYTEAINTFYEDISVGDFARNTLMVTFSEFGRTIDQNGSYGTDHAAAFPIWCIGEDIVDTPANRIIGEGPTTAMLDDTSNNDLPFEHDFRSLYATLLQDWLCVEPQLVDFVLRNNYDRIPDLVYACSPEIGSNKAKALLGHETKKEESGVYVIKYAIPNTGLVKLNILNASGQVVHPLFNGIKTKGSHSINFKPANHSLDAGLYIYELMVGGQIYSKRLKIF